MTKHKSKIIKTSLGLLMLFVICGGNITHAQTGLGVPVNGIDEESTPGNYNIIYTATNSSGLSGQTIRNVNLGSLATTTRMTQEGNTDGCGDLDLQAQEINLEKLKTTYLTLTGNTARNIERNNPDIVKPASVGSGVSWLDDEIAGNQQDIWFVNQNGQNAENQDNGSPGGLIANCWEETSPGSDFYDSSVPGMSQFAITRIQTPNNAGIAGHPDVDESGGDQDFLKGWHWGSWYDAKYKIMGIDGLANMIYMLKEQPNKGSVYKTWIDGLYDDDVNNSLRQTSYLTNISYLINSNEDHGSANLGIPGDKADLCIPFDESGKSPWSVTDKNKADLTYAEDIWDNNDPTKHLGGLYNCGLYMRFIDTGFAPSARGADWLATPGTGAKFVTNDYNDPHGWESMQHIHFGALAGGVLVKADYRDGGWDGNYPSQKWYADADGSVWAQIWNQTWDKDIAEVRAVHYQPWRKALSTSIGLW